MLSFESDYINGAHPVILERLVAANDEICPGYGGDIFAESAKKKIKKHLNCDADIYFLTGGTQTNAVVISSVLDRYMSVICAETGHINVHEAGAIEYSGHKVVGLKGKDGKLEGDTLEKYLEDFFADSTYPHMTLPGMVYISHPTEYGTLYTKSELERLSQICKNYNLSLYLDGARLAYGLMAHITDVTIEDIAKLCDIFYIGGTKAGALCGEAVVFTHGNTPKSFFTSVKQHGALLAKGRLLSVQFDALFTDGLYFEIGRNAINMAEKLKSLFDEKGYSFFLKTPTNQQFIVLENSLMASLSEKVRFSFWEKYDDSHTVVRFATSWSTTDEDIEKLRQIL